MPEQSQSLSDALERALNHVGIIIRNVTSEQWGDPTPCDEWSVRDVATHIIGMNRVFAAMLVGDPLPERAPIADDDLSPDYERSSAQLVAVFRQPGILEQVLSSPMGSSTGADRLQIRMYDLLAHGWDIARATSQSTDELPADLAEESLRFAQGQVDTIPREGRFKPPQSSPVDANAIDRLAVFLGRDLSRWP